MVTKSENKFIKFLVDNFAVWGYYLILIGGMEIAGIDLRNYRFITVPLSIISALFMIIALLNTKFLSKEEQKELMDERYMSIIFKASRTTTMLFNTISLITAFWFMDSELNIIGFTILAFSLIHMIIFNISKSIYDKKM